ncbi:MAG: hypothetical protein ABIL40_08040 [candidate division WOR-3 bacterium]
MTLVTGIVCQYKGEECILLTGDKAVSYGTRIFESPKIKQINDYKIIMGESGSSSDLQRFYYNFVDFLDGFFTEEREQYKNKLTQATDFFLIESPYFLEKFCDSEIYGDVVLGVTDEKRSKLYHIHSGCTKALEISDFVCIGSGAEIIGKLMIKSLYNPKVPPSLDEAVRLAGVVNILASRLTTGVSSNFDCLSVHNGKIGKLTETSKGQLIKDVNFIVNKWLGVMRKIFFLPTEKSLGFIAEANADKIMKDFEKSEEKHKKNFVLIIDDSYSSQKGVYKQIEKILSKEKLVCEVFKSRSEFKSGFKSVKNKLRIVFLDRRIEHRVSTDILKVMNESGLNVPIVLLSRGLKEQDIESFLQKGISFHISKEEIENEPEKAEELISGILKEGNYLWKWDERIRE